MLRSSEIFAVIFFLAGSLLVMASFTGVETSTYLMILIGQIAAFSLLALSLDLIWGFCGILSLGHGLYFAIGGYLIAMHLVKVAFEKTGTPPDFMLFMGWEELPTYYFGIESFAYLLFIVVLVTLSISLILIARGVFPVPPMYRLQAHIDIIFNFSLIFKFPYKLSINVI